MSDYLPEEHEFSSMAEYILALHKLCQMAEHSLYLFERNFDGLGFNAEESYNTLRKFLLSSPVHKLHILAHDTHYLSTQCPRLITLLGQFGTNMFIYQTPKNLQNITAPFAVADEEHLVRRFHFDNARGVLSVQDSSNAHIFKTRFMDMWAASRPATSTTRLGL